jgi:uncharacterized protein (TIGR03067 family)
MENGINMKPEIKQLQGTWNIVTLEVEGRPMPPGDGRIVVKGERFTSLGMGARYEGKLTVDASQNPKAFDLTFTANLPEYDWQGTAQSLCHETEEWPRAGDSAAGERKSARSKNRNSTGLAGLEGGYTVRP